MYQEPALFMSQKSVDRAKIKLNPTNTLKMGSFPVRKKGQVLGYRLTLEGKAVTEETMNGLYAKT